MPGFDARFDACPRSVADPETTSACQVIDKCLKMGRFMARLAAIISLLHKSLPIMWLQQIRSEELTPSRPQLAARATSCTLFDMSKYFDSALGQQLRSARVARGLSQGDVARLADLSRATVVALERSPGTARVHSLLSAARACGLAVNAQETSPQLLERRLARAQQAQREEERYALHLRLAAKLLTGQATDPLRKARRTLAQWERGKTCSTFYIDAWSRMLSGTQPIIGKRLADLSRQEGAALFQNTPFGATLGAYRPKDPESAVR